MIDYLFQNNILTGMIWEPEITDDKGLNFQNWLNKIRRTHSQYIYTTDNGGLLKGYSEKRSSELEPLAIHVKDHFGDGIYYINDSRVNDDIYFLVINESRILSGSDRIVKKNFFDSLMCDLKQSTYSHLELKELKTSWLEGLALLSHQRQAILKRKQKIFITGVSAVGVILLVIMAIFLNMLLS